MENARDLVLRIHGTPHKAVLAITGGGAEVIGELLRHGQGSNTLLEAVVPYDQKAFDQFVRGTPDKYCSAEAARDLAMAAFQRAMRMGVPSPTPLLGIGVTCSLAKDNEREGRKHHAYVSIQTASQTVSWELYLEQLPRAEQEAHVANFILHAMADMCGVGATLPGNYGETIARVGPDVIMLTMGLKHVFPEVPDVRGRVIFPGSFNPIHEQHLRIAEVASQLTGKKVDLEICVHNVDKPALNYHDFNNRQHQLAVCVKDQSWFGTAFFTALPTFKQKASHFPEATFVVGWDTFSRISESKYGDLDDVVHTFKVHKIQFLVFDRLVNGKPASENVSIHASIMKMAQFIGPDVLPPVEMASSTIRKRA